MSNYTYMKSQTQALIEVNVFYQKGTQIYSILQITELIFKMSKIDIPTIK